jgi:glycosyltransferase involved in cell wall biosynthesis
MYRVVSFEDFLNPQQLADILMDTVLNMHPAKYEAFGMTIVEAGSCGVPTILNCEGIGAEQLLASEKGASIPVTIDDIGKVANKVMELLKDPQHLAKVGREAYKAATSWTEGPHVAALWDLIETQISSAQEACDIN